MYCAFPTHIPCFLRNVLYSIYYEFSTNLHDYKYIICETHYFVNYTKQTTHYLFNFYSALLRAFNDAY